MFLVSTGMKQRCLLTVVLALAVVASGATEVTNAGRCTSGRCTNRRPPVLLQTSATTLSQAIATSSISAGYPVSAKYVKIQAGKCEDHGLVPVHDVGMCEEAGAKFGVADATVSMTNLPQKPWGCYILTDVMALWIGRSAANQTSVPAMESRQSICTKPFHGPVRILGGTCNDIGMTPIHDNEMCKGAARSLGLDFDDMLMTTDKANRREGCYWFTPHGSLWMSTNSSNQGRPADYYSQNLCVPANWTAGESSNVLGGRSPFAPFMRIANGSCADRGLAPIHDIGVCETAAATLGLTDETASTTVDSGRPWGCYWYHPASALWMGLGSYNGQGPDASDFRRTICGNTTNAEFVRIAGGRCADIGMYSIHSPGTCKDAIVSLGLQDNENEVLESGSRERPEGCYWFTPSGRAWIARSSFNVGNPATKYRQSICSRTREEYTPPKVSMTFDFGKQLPAGEVAELDTGSGYGAKTADGFTYGWSCNGNASFDLKNGQGATAQRSFSNMGSTKFDRQSLCRDCTTKNEEAPKTGEYSKEKTSCQKECTWMPVSWEVEVPRGNYRVEVIFPGDATEACEVEGELACLGDEDDDQDYCKYDKIRHVADGRLTVTGYSHKSGLCSRLAKVAVTSVN